MPFGTHLFAVAELNGTYLIAIEPGAAFTLIFGFLALLATIPVLANIPQPKPIWTRR
jgi:hypothetical protein